VRCLCEETSGDGLVWIPLRGQDQMRYLYGG
jgi:hypothetical protein